MAMVDGLGDAPTCSNAVPVGENANGRAASKVSYPTIAKTAIAALSARRGESSTPLCCRSRWG